MGKLSLHPLGHCRPSCTWMWLVDLEPGSFSVTCNTGVRSSFCSTQTPRRGSQGGTKTTCNGSSVSSSKEGGKRMEGDRVNDRGCQSTTLALIWLLMVPLIMMLWPGLAEGCCTAGRTKAPCGVPGTQSPKPTFPHTLCPLQSASCPEGKRSRIWCWKRFALTGRRLSVRRAPPARRAQRRWLQLMKRSMRPWKRCPGRSQRRPWARTGKIRGTQHRTSKAYKGLESEPSLSLPPPLPPDIHPFPRGTVAAEFFCTIPGTT